MKFKLAIFTIFIALIGLNASAQQTKDNTNKNPDMRIKLPLTPVERHLVLLEMRNFVIAINSILDGIATDDMTKVATSARTMGSAAANAVPPSVVAKLPYTFKTYAGNVHTTFDQIALDAEAFGDNMHTIGQLSKLTQNCVGCHAIYQIETINLNNRISGN